MKRLALLGATGSIGVQTLDIVRENPERFSVTVLTANRQWELLARQALEFRPAVVVIADERYYGPLKERLAGERIEVLAGEEAIAAAVADSRVDTVVNALVGYAGLRPTVAALEAGKELAQSRAAFRSAAGVTGGPSKTLYDVEVDD